jgi:hypothetical protein
VKHDAVLRHVKALRQFGDEAADDRFDLAA